MATNNELTLDALEPFVGIFDSGAGGISVLGELMRELPAEDFVYFGDSAYNPYGEKPCTWIVQRSREICETLVQAGAKAIVVACNTATAAAAHVLRDEFSNVPIIGVEPALKPATEATGIKRILVMATPLTLHQDKYQKLTETYQGDHQVVSIECPGLAARIEQGHLDAPDLTDLVRSLVGAYRDQIDAVVLGCTHYAFITPVIKNVVGDLPFFDGAQGTARQLRRRLEENDLLASSEHTGSVRFFTSGPQEESLALYDDFYRVVTNASCR